MIYSSYTPVNYKSNLICCLVDRAYKICSSYLAFTNELEFLRRYFLSNNFPLFFIEKYYRIMLNNIFVRRESVLTVSQKIMYLKIPFCGSYSYTLKRKICQLFKKYYPQIKLRIILDNSNTIASMFRFKDRLPNMLCSGIVYKYSCGDCGATYVGKSQRHLKTRISEHRGLSVRTGQQLSRPAFSNIRDHAWQKEHRIKDENFKIIERSYNKNDLLILEAIAIVKHRPNLNEYNPGMLSLF